MFYFLSHILGKAILFSTAGILVYQNETRDLKKMGGLWSQMPLTAVLWVCASLILSALPPTSGFVGKWLLFAGALKAFSSDPLGLSVIILAILSTLLTLVYTFLTGIRIFGGQQITRGHTRHATDPPLTMSLPLLALAGVAFVLGIFPKPFLELLGSVVGAF
jgi:formate hydrogenlyase subunit 3/multisubunit Na+/H+ antiporter MnhD subunit